MDTARASADARRPPAWIAARSTRSASAAHRPRELRCQAGSSGIARNAQIGAPRSNLLGVLSRHHTADLRDVSEVVRDPGCQELAQGHHTKIRVAALAIEIAGGELTAAQRHEVLLAQRGKGLEQ